MKKTLFSLSLALAALTLQATQGDTTSYLQISNVTLDQLNRNQDVVVTYTLANNGEPAYIFLDILTNGVSIGTKNIKTLSGDVSTTNTIAEGNRTIVWKARSDWRGHLASNAIARVYGYYTNDIAEISGVYMVIDLSKGTAATAENPYPVTYTLTPPEVNDMNRTTKLWLRRIDPGTFSMGRQTNEDAYTQSAFKSREVLHKVTLTNAFFAGVFEVTKKQYELVMGSSPASQSGATDITAVNRVSYNAIRGCWTNAAYNWPNKSSVDPNSFMGLIQTRTGIAEFDLPTEAQWEYACRAGTTTAWNNGTCITNSQYDANLSLLGWYHEDSSNKMQPAGERTPNAWGLYDLHGNAFEWCLDWYQENVQNLPDASLNPKGPAGSGNRVLRGGSWNYSAECCRSAYRHMSSPDLEAAVVGFRLFRTIP